MALYSSPQPAARRAALVERCFMPIATSFLAKQGFPARGTG